jgi:hypothetical protein
VLLACALAAALASCALIDPNAVDNRGDYAIDTYYPPRDATALAEQRARQWWQRNQQRFGAQPPYLAVQTNLLLQGEIVQNLYAKMIRSKTTSLFFAQGIDRYPVFTIYGVVIFDTRTNRVVSPQGYAVVDTPPRGRIAHFGPYLARYIGTGK